MARLVKNTCWYINFLHFAEFVHNIKNLSKHSNIFKIKICSNLPNNFFIQMGIVAKPFELEYWNFAWKNGRSYTVRRYKAEFFNINTLRAIKVSFVTVVIDGRVSTPETVSILAAFTAALGSVYSPVSGGILSLRSGEIVLKLLDGVVSSGESVTEVVLLSAFGHLVVDVRLRDRILQLFDRVALTIHFAHWWFENEIR